MMKKNKGFNFYSLIRVLRNPWCILPGILLGLYIGIFEKDIALMLTPFGNLYLELLKMCVLPLLFSAITMSVGRLISSQEANKYVKRILIVFSIGLIGVSIIGLIVTLLTNPGGNLDDSSLTTLGIIVNKSQLDLEVSLTGKMIEEVVEQKTTLISFLLNLVPENIFASLSEGKALEILFFAIVFGLAMGYLKQSYKEEVFNILETIFKASKKLIDWIILFLPMGLCCLLASQIATTGFGILAAMKNFVIITILIFFIIYVVSTLVVWQKTDCSLWEVLISLKEPTILALATRSSFTCLPSSISALTELLKFEKQTVNLVIPLAITVCRFGPVAYFATTSVFVAQLYQHQLNLSSFVVIIVASILAGMATAGATGILTLTLLDLVLQPLGLPLEAILVLLIAVDPIIDPFRTLSIVHTGIAATAAVADYKRSPALDSQVQRSIV
ncbi:MAG: dicarboxylate/amino acid:cation symporter [Okeania sp. SIO3B5]|uniref:dicarboxylate/amino acid:cation symporter n=1 Tax=Okeania sp. SIO3B5 TaxID=2607811 RepID=UPI0013FF4C7C|nr:cation:dicarboxylase symporter family transporter [Okeania sp. SIO3B5]NEO56009.1 dicarboxylate/amino acid:cation symporter [Okeania sp. SIO3B5]